MSATTRSAVPVDTASSSRSNLGAHRAELAASGPPNHSWGPPWCAPVRPDQGRVLEHPPMTPRSRLQTASAKRCYTSRVLERRPIPLRGRPVRPSSKRRSRTVRGVPGTTHPRTRVSVALTASDSRRTRTPRDASGTSEKTRSSPPQRVAEAPFLPAPRSPQAIISTGDRGTPGHSQTDHRAGDGRR
jgi:hypothetical protein